MSNIFILLFLLITLSSIHPDAIIVSIGTLREHQLSILSTNMPELRFSDSSYYYNKFISCRTAALKLVSGSMFRVPFIIVYILMYKYYFYTGVSKCEICLSPFGGDVLSLAEVGVQPNRGRGNSFYMSALCAL